MIHRITRVNLETKIGHCALCGSVKVKHNGTKKNGETKWLCDTLRKKHDQTYRNSPHGKRNIRRLGWKQRTHSELDLATLTLYETTTHCECCGSPRPQNSKNFHIDHNHTTGKIRGFLCKGCNFGIGYFGDSVERLQKAIDYLKQKDNPTNQRG